MLNLLIYNHLLALYKYVVNHYFISLKYRATLNDYLTILLGKRAILIMGDITNSNPYSMNGRQSVYCSVSEELELTCLSNSCHTYACVIRISQTSPDRQHDCIIQDSRQCEWQRAKRNNATGFSNAAFQTTSTALLPEYTSCFEYCGMGWTPVSNYMQRRDCAS